MNKLLEQLAVLGLSQYEARTYISLVENQPCTPYEIGKNSGVPTSKIYEVLQKLSDRSMVQELEKKGQTRLYVAASPDSFLADQKKGYERLFTDLKKSFDSLEKAEVVSPVWNFQEFQLFQDKVQTLIESAQSSVLLSLWPDELSEFRGSIQKAAKKGIKQAIVLFGAATDELEKWQSELAGMVKIYFHPIEDTLYKEKGGRGFLLVTDSSTAVQAVIDDESSLTHASWSNNTGYVLLAEDYIKHDIYIMKIVKRFNRELVDVFGKGYNLLRDIFRDDEIR